MNIQLVTTKQWRDHILVIEGYCQVDMDESQLQASAGDMLMIPADVAHNQISDDYIHTLYAGFHVDSLLTEAQVIHLDELQMIESCMSLPADTHMH